MGNFIRVSYSLLSKVEAGYIDEALAMLQGKDLPSTEAQEAGKKLHEYTELYIKKNKRLPDLLGGEPIEGNTEKFITTTLQVNDWTIEVVGVVDHVNKERTIVQDWKFGKTQLSSYVGGTQHKIYKLLIPTAKHFVYRLHNPYEDSLRSAFIRLSDKDADEAREWVEHYAMELVGHVLYMIGNRQKYSIYTGRTRRFVVENNTSQGFTYF